MDDRSFRIGARLLDLCIAILLGAMALYGAVLIIQAIWKPLCIMLAVVGLFSASAWFISARIRRW